MSEGRRRPRPSLYEEIADIIRDRIVEGGLPAGSFVDELALAAALEVSRTPIREALKVLAFEGLVDIFPNQGSRVAELTPRTPENSSNFWRNSKDLLESLSVNAAARKC